MIEYNISSLSPNEIASSKAKPFMQQRLKKQGRNTIGYDYSHDMAMITHFLAAKGHTEEISYQQQALALLREYYLAAHTNLNDDVYMQLESMENLFATLLEIAPVGRRFRQNADFTFIDLFAGIGGFRIALEQLGGHCVFASEIDKAAKHTYALNHGVVPFGDITHQEIRDLIPEHYDVLCAGFPCQPFSMAGLRRGFDDPSKGTLFYEVIQIIAHTHPRVVFLENVPGLLSIRNDDGTLTIDTIRLLLEGEGYYVPNPKVVNAADFGVPQNRNRVFIAAFLDEGDRNFVYPNGADIPRRTFGDIREPMMVQAKYYMSAQYLETLRRHRNEQHANGRGYGYRIINDEDVCHTLLVGGMGLERNLVIDPRNPNVNDIPDPRGELNHDNIRVLTERECMLVQGFPEYFTLLNTSRHAAYKQFGNSVAVPAVKEMARAMLEYARIPFHEIE